MNDFSKKTMRQLAAKGISLVGLQAIPLDSNDHYFSDTAYQLVWNGTSFIRTHSQVIVLAASSWNPEIYFNSLNVATK